MGAVCFLPHHARCSERLHVHVLDATEMGKAFGSRVEGGTVGFAPKVSRQWRLSFTSRVFVVRAYPSVVVFQPCGCSLLRVGKVMGPKNVPQFPFLGVWLGWNL